MAKTPSDKPRKTPSTRKAAAPGKQAPTPAKAETAGRGVVAADTPVVKAGPEKQSASAPTPSAPTQPEANPVATRPDAAGGTAEANASVAAAKPEDAKAEKAAGPVAGAAKTTPPGKAPARSRSAKSAKAPSGATNGASASKPSESGPQSVLSVPPAEAPLGATIPAELRFMAGQGALPEVDMRPESLTEEVLPAPAEQHSLPPVTPYPPANDWDGLSMSEPAYEPEPEQVYQEYQPQPSRPSLFIVQITPELAPVAKVGGLADVVFGLSNELEIRGNHVEVILPKYDCMRYDHIWGLCQTFDDLWVPWYGGAIHCSVFFGFVHGRKCFFIEPHSGDNFFNRGCIYGFNDDVMRFAFFTRAAMEFLWQSGKTPDIIHCHDWQTALAPVFLYEIYQHMGMWHPRVCFTIHNFKHQGVTGAQVLHATGLNRPEYYFHYDRLRDNHNPHALNLMKAGVVYANFVTTVSPRHAFEAKDQGQGFGLEPSLHIHHVKYGGVVNGIDYSFWNPELDHHIPVHYSVDTIEDKYHNKKALRDRLMIADSEKPIVAFVGRLDPQKGLELIRHAIFYTLQRGGQFVLLGSSPDGQINNYFWSLKHQLNDNPDCHIEIGFNEELSHLIYAGADMVLVPSRFEPCGLTQLIALRYGTIPVVREVGGLADTVFDKDFSHRPLHERNGYVFRDYDEAGLESALGRAISCYYEYPEHFRELMKNAMRCDYSWNHPGADYVNIYDMIRSK